MKVEFHSCVTHLYFWWRKQHSLNHCQECPLRQLHSKTQQTRCNKCTVLHCWKTGNGSSYYIMQIHYAWKLMWRSQLSFLPCMVLHSFLCSARPLNKVWLVPTRMTSNLTIVRASNGHHPLRVVNLMPHIAVTSGTSAAGPEKCASSWYVSEMDVQE